MSEYLQVIFLGIVQGIAEFLPISSSGHLVLSQELLKRWSGQDVGGHDDLALDVALHVGTLGSILVVYFKDLLKIFQTPRIIALVVAGTIPAAVVGLTLKSKIEATFQNPLIVGVCLLITAGLLLAGQNWERVKLTLGQMPFGSAFIIGLFQAVALLPGVSRAGSTIAGGLITGLSRDDAAKYSFLLAIPAIGGAAVLTLKDVLEEQSAVNWSLLGVGAFVSFVVGFFALKALLALITRNKLHYFAYYCLTVGLLTIIWQVWELTSRGN
jgi:undecaprenyl-diphosphatase